MAETQAYAVPDLTQALTYTNPMALPDMGVQQTQLDQLFSQNPVSMPLNDVISAIQSQYQPVQVNTGDGTYGAARFIGTGANLDSYQPVSEIAAAKSWYTPGKFDINAFNKTPDEKLSELISSGDIGSNSGSALSEYNASTDASTQGQNNYGGINAGPNATLAGLIGGFMLGPIGSLLGRYALPAITNSNNATSIATNLGYAGYSQEAISAGISAAGKAASMPGATSGSIAAAAANAASQVDNTDALDAIFSVTNNFGTTNPAAETTAPSQSSNNGGFSYGDTSDSGYSADTGYSGGGGWSDSDSSGGWGGY